MTKRAKYDPFFSASLEYLPIAQDFFRHYLPPHLKAVINVDKIVRVDRKNTDAKLKQRQRDIIYQASLDNNVCYLACEHDSLGRLPMFLRMLKYQVDTLDMHMKAGNKKLPIVINLLFYHGEKSPYPRPCQSTDYYESPHWGNLQLYFQYYVVDSTLLPDKIILTHGLCAPMVLLLKHGRDGNFELPLDAYREAFQRCIRVVGDECITIMLKYAAYLPQSEIGEKIYNFIEEVLENKKATTMTYAKKLEKIGEKKGKQEGEQIGMQKGEQIGMQKGEQKERFSIAKKMFQEGITTSIIKKITGFSEETLHSLG